MDIIDEVIKTEIYEVNSHYYPLYTTVSGKKFIARQSPTGNCWVLDWEEYEVSSGN